MEALTTRIMPPPDPELPPAERARGGVISLLLLLALGIAPLYGVLHLVLGQLALAALVFGFTSVIFLTLTWLRRKGPVEPAAHVLCAAALLTIVVVGGQWGQLSSPALPWLPLVPALAALALGFKRARLWIFLCLAGVTVLALLAQQQGSDPIQQVVFRALSVGGACIIGPALVAIYESLWRESQKSLHQVNEELQTQIRQREEAQRRDTEARELYGSLVGLSPEAVVVHCHGVVRYCNRSAAELMAADSTEDLIGRPVLDLLHPDDRDRARRRIADILNADRAAPFAEYRVRTFDGREVPVEIAGVAIHYEGDHGVQVLLRDIRERKRTEETLRRSAQELEARNAELRRARDAAVQATTLKSQFLANVSHEIRTPLNAVLGMAQLLIETDLDHEQREYAQIIDQSGNGLLQLINDILDLSRVEAGKLELECLPYRILDVVREAERLVRPQAEEKGLRFGIDAVEPLPEWNLGDPHRVRQVLLNLASNAVKFTTEGDICIRVHRLERDGQSWIRTEIVDTGIGIPAHVQSRLFESFMQADGSTTRRHGGSGLGLSISRELVELMSGHIGLESEPGQGSSFWFELPLRSVSQAAAKSLMGTGREPLADRRVLLCISDPSIGKATEQSLRQEGAVVQLAVDGDSAALWLQASSWDALVVDLDAPGVDGAGGGAWLLGRAVDSAAAAPRPRVVYCGRRIDAARGARLRSEGADAVLAAPAAPDMLRRALGQLFVARTEHIV